MTDRNLLNKEKSLILKGIGIMLMLIHHLFYDLNSRALYDDLIVNVHGHEFGLTHQLGIYGKLCVTLFVFLSGYGLCVSTPKEFNIKKFYIKRLTKLYLNYWFIVLLFVPIGVFVFKRTLPDVYGEHVILNGILELFGLISAFGKSGYNPTWWFYSCIIILYLLYPLLNKYLSLHYLSLFTVCLIVSFCVYVPVLGPIAWYLLPFIAGMFTARISFEQLNRIKPFEAFICFLLLSVIRNFGGNLIFMIDTLLCFELAVLVYHWNHQGLLKAVFLQLGKHSMNIFLFHTFIFNYWFKEETYISRNPLIIVVQLLVVCFMLSIVIEAVKKRIGFYKLCGHIA